MQYYKLLDALHRHYKPLTYFEIGCQYGYSLRYARCESIAVDPKFSIRQQLSFPTRLYRCTSDQFFASYDLTTLFGGPLDFAFIDGMHLSENVLRDFYNVEHHCHPGSIIALHDVYPADMSWTTRERQTSQWTGDVYKAVLFLLEQRPDLDIKVVDLDKIGVALVTKVNPKAEPLPADPDLCGYTVSSRSALTDRYTIVSTQDLLC